MGLDDEVARALQEEALQRLSSVFGDREDVVLAIIDRHLRMRWASPVGARAVYGRELESFRDVPIDAFLHPDDLLIARQALHRVFAGETATWEVRAATAEGDWVRTRNTGWVASSDRRLAIVLSVVTDQGGDPLT